MRWTAVARSLEEAAAGLGHRTSRGDPQALGAWGDSGTGSRYQEESGGVRSCRGPSAMLARPGGASGTPVARGLYHVEPSDWSRAAELAWRSRGSRGKSAGGTLWTERSRQADPQLHTPERRQERCGASGRDRVSIICPTPSESPTRAGDGTRGPGWGQAHVAQWASTCAQASGSARVRGGSRSTRRRQSDNDELTSQARGRATRTGGRPVQDQAWTTRVATGIKARSKGAIGGQRARAAGFSPVPPGRKGWSGWPDHAHRGDARRTSMGKRRQAGGE